LGRRIFNKKLGASKMLFARIKSSKWVTGSAGKLRVFRVKPLLGYDPGLKLLRFRLRYALMNPENKLLANDYWF